MGDDSDEMPDLMEGEANQELDFEALALQKKTEGNTKYANKNFRGAAKSYAEAIALNPEEHTFRGNRAAALMMFSNYEEALEECEKAIAMAPGFTKAYLRGAKCKLQQGDFKGATELLTTIKSRPEGQRDPTVTKDLALVDDVKAKLEVLKTLTAAEKWEEAMPGIGFLLIHMGEAKAVQIMAVETLIGCGQFARAATICSALYRKYSSETNIQTLRGTTAYYQGQVETALKMFKQILQADPDNRKTQHIYKRVKKLEKKKAEGNEAFKYGRSKEAYELYTEALTIDPLNKDYNATLLGNRAAASMKLKQWTQAIQDCDQSLRLRRDHIKTMLRRGQCKLELERYQDAIREFEKAKELDPQNRDIRQQLQNAQLELKKSKRKNYYKILEVDKNSDERVIKKAYRKMALKWHPDKNSETPEQHTAAEAKFKDITEAYTVLSDATKRRRYDSGADMDGSGGGCGGHQEQDVNHIFRQFFGQQGGF